MSLVRFRCSRGFQRLPGPLRATRQFPRVAFSWRHFDAHCRIRVVAILLRREIELDQIAPLNLAIPGNPVNHLVIHADAHITRKPVNHGRRRPCSVLGKHSRANLAKLRSRHSLSHLHGHGAQRFPHDHSARPQLLKLFATINGHGASHKPGRS